MNDTIILSANASQNVMSLNSFKTGIPAEYGGNLTYFFAFDASGRLSVSPSSYPDRTEFQWLEVSFPQLVNVSYGGSYNFTVVYVFSGLVGATGTSAFRADFPLYPSLTVSTGPCNVTVVLPSDAGLTSYASDFSNKTVESVWVLNNETSSVGAFANASSWVQFSSSTFQILEIDEFKRQITIDSFGKISVTDYYQLTNKALGYPIVVSLTLPSDAEAISVQDIYGTLSGVTVSKEATYTEVTVTLRGYLWPGDNVKLLVNYGLPSEKNIIRDGWQDYTLNVSLARPQGWILRAFSVVVSFPEGASFQSATIPSTVAKEGFTETASFYEYNVTRFHDLSLNLKYQYSILWAAFRPTLWVGVGAAIVALVLFVRRPLKIAVATTPFSTEILKKFVDTYEEKRRVEHDRESLDQQAMKKKISRRRYKLRRSSLDGRISKMQRELAEGRKEIERIGSQYKERMRQLEVSETEIETSDRDIARVDARYRRHEVSAEARKRLLDEYNRRKERAENIIAETLLRLREEIR